MGCHRLLRESDATCVTTFAEVRAHRACGSFEGPGRGDPGARDTHTGDRTRILDALSARSPRTVADVARRAGFGFGEAAGLLGM
jgi:DNA processing protein